MTKALADFIKLLQSDIIPRAIEAYNEVVGPQRFAKLPRKIEVLPTSQKQLSSYRTRLGTMMEYSISSIAHDLLRARRFPTHKLTFMYAHQYPDFVWRDEKNKPVFRLEMKAVDAESDEHAARFDAPTESIDPKNDAILFLAWQWKDMGEWEFPFIFSSCCISAAELARERDLGLKGRGGIIQAGKVLVPSTKKVGEMVEDPGNYGKLWRIVPKQRRAAADLTPDIQEFLRFLKAVNERATRKRY